MKKNSLIILLVFIGVYIVTFPSFYPDISIGLDGSYQWALSHLLLEDYSFLTTLVYPVGPLAFLKMPTIEGGLFWWFLLFYTFLKFLFYYQFYYLSKNYKCNKQLTIVLLLVASYFISIDLLIIFNILFLSFNYYKLKKSYLVYLAVFLVTIAISIKTSLGVISVSVLLSLFLIEIKSISKNVKTIIISVLIFIIVGSVVFLSPSNFVYYLSNIFKLSSGYTEALTLYPLNNWALLFLTIIPFYILFTKKSDVRILLFISLPSLFATWKHSMVREDVYHVKQFFWFIIIFWVSSILISRKKKSIIFLLGFISVYSFYLNFNNLPLYSKYPFDFNGVGNFNKTVLKSSVFEEEMNFTSQNNLKNNILPDTILDIVGSNSIDFYPWDLTYAAANDLNWVPRSTLQSGAYNHWLDSINSKGFGFKDGPKYILFNLYTNDLTELNSIDDRYILNDEPISLDSIFTNYKIVYTNEKFLLFEKNKNHTISSTSELAIRKFSVNQWNLIPKELSREKIKLSFSYDFLLMYKIQSFLFKGKPFFIDYKLCDDRIYSFRFTPNSMIDGLWLSPYIESINDNLYFDVKEFRIRIDENILKSYEGSFLISSFNLLPKNDISNIVSSNLIVDSICEIPPKGFSKSFNYKYFLDTAIGDDFVFDVSLNYKFSKLWQKNTSLVLEIKDVNGKTIHWENWPLNTTRKLKLMSTKHVIIDSKDYTDLLLKKCSFNIYIWNNSDNEILINQFRVNLYK